MPGSGLRGLGGENSQALYAPTTTDNRDSHAGGALAESRAGDGAPRLMPGGGQGQMFTGGIHQ